MPVETELYDILEIAHDGPAGNSCVIQYIGIRRLTARGAVDIKKAYKKKVLCYVLMCVIDVLRVSRPRNTTQYVLSVSLHV